ncbi:MAG: glutaminyl-peptide cyclotransferase [Alistipes sp.]|nr:glutaminyl-peptide cyclotransferase [Alistipes sp.]
MNRFLAALLLPAVMLSCGGGRKASTHAAPAEPKRYTYRVKAEYPHPADFYTQGLQFADGKLWEGTGLEGESAIYSTDLTTGRTEKFASSPRNEFGEGITLLGGKLYQLTWTQNTARVYDLATGRVLREFRYPGEGWGLTTDGSKLYMSNGTSSIYRIDPETFRRESSVTVTLRGEPLEFLNELEWIDSRIWANIYTTDVIAVIDPATGRVESLVDLRGLLPESERTPRTDVLNGIAYDSHTGRILVTGKRWSKIYEIELVEQ